MLLKNGAGVERFRVLRLRLGANTKKAINYKSDADEPP